VSPWARKLGLLSALYFVQGMPFGFVTGALSLYLLDRGVEAKMLGFLGVLFLPYWLKALWAPLVDRFGRRRSWILPLQLLLAASAWGASFAVGDGREGASLWVVLGLVLVMNLFAAAQDVAVDGLAVDLLGQRELGMGNAAQVCGYKLGGWTTGGLLVWQLEAVGGWPGLFRVMALAALAGFALALAFREPSSPEVRAAAAGRWRMREVLVELGRALAVPRTAWLLLFIGSYKLGESMLDVYFRPFLKESGLRTQDIGLWVGTLGNAVSVLGSLAGGALASLTSPLRAVAWTSALRVLPLAGEWGLAVAGPTAGAVVAVTCAENLFGGALTTAMFAFMMSRVDRKVGASHFTLFATVELLGKMPGGPLAGLLRGAGWSYADIFATGTVLSLLFLGLLLPFRRAPAATQGVPSSAIG
jgi:MFS transporter, PAT family, beta-lactamase induction signal transducer AmpG